MDALHVAFGEHHARAVHAKGILLEGSFTAGASAKTLSRSPIFAGGTLPVIARFSDFTGIPDIPDTASDANPRGFAIKIKASERIMSPAVACRVVRATSLSSQSESTPRSLLARRSQSIAFSARAVPPGSA